MRKVLRSLRQSLFLVLFFGVNRSPTRVPGCIDEANRGTALVYKALYFVCLDQEFRAQTGSGIVSGELKSIFRGDDLLCHLINAVGLVAPDLWCDYGRGLRFDHIVIISAADGSHFQ